MTFIHLNLLAPIKKARLNALVRYIFIKENLELAMLTVALFASLQLWGWLILTNILADWSQTTIHSSPAFNAYNQGVRSINRTMKDITRAGSDVKPITPLLLDVAKTLPDTIKITSLDFASAKQTISLTGLAATREALLRYHQTLRALPWIQAVSTPASELFQKENVLFTLTAQLKPAPATPAPRTLPATNATP